MKDPSGTVKDPKEVVTGKVRVDEDGDYRPTQVVDETTVEKYREMWTGRWNFRNVDDRFLDKGTKLDFGSSNKSQFPQYREVVRK